MTLVGIVGAYIGLILWIVAFLNPFFLILELVLLAKYFIWEIRSIKMRVLKKQKRKVTAFLEAENKRFYFRKLVKWKLDNESNKILLQNLRG